MFEVPWMMGEDVITHLGAEITTEDVLRKVRAPTNREKNQFCRPLRGLNRTRARDWVPTAYADGLPSAAPSGANVECETLMPRDGTAFFARLKRN